jgi:zinc transport system substrate-binding protein
MDKKNLLIASGLFAVLVIAAVGYTYNKTGVSQPDGEPTKMAVVASFYPLYYLSSQIGGDKAAVYNITPAGAEPHDYEPTAQDLARIEKSRLLVLNGGGLEAWAEDISKNIDPAATAVVVAGEGLMTGQVEEDGQRAADPHIWLSPQLAQRMADRITQAFVQADPANGEYYQANAQVLNAKLQGLDAEYRQGLSDCASKSIITSHAAFGYLAAAYGLTQVSISGLAPEAEPSPQQLIGIAKFAKDNQVKYIFFESLVSPKLAETIANEVGAQTLVLDPLEGLSDAELAAGKDYLTEMRNNLANLKTALACKQ